MINTLLLIIIIAIGIIIKSSQQIEIFNNAAYALGLIMLAGYISGDLVKKIKLPSITGCILAGILVGPFGLELISIKNVDDLQLLNGLALSIIALTAGGEIKLAGFKKNLKTINYILLFQTLIIVVGITFVIIIFKDFFPFISNLGIQSIVAAGLLVAIISTASSPSTTLAVIVETKKRDRYTNLILSIVMLKDVIILFLFCIGLNIAKILTKSNMINKNIVFNTFFEISGSLISGIVIGFIIVVYLKFIKKDRIVFILALSFFSFEIFEPLHLHTLLIMMIAGFVVENFSSEGDSLMKTLELISPPVYIIFFTLTGAAINLKYLKSLWLLTIIIVLFRALFKYVGTYIGSALAREEKFVKKHLWISFLSQAGLSLGMAKIIENNFSFFGENLAVLIISVIVVNQIIGPPLLKMFLDKPKQPKIKDP